LILCPLLVCCFVLGFLLLLSHVVLLLLCGGLTVSLTVDPEASSHTDFKWSGQNGGPSAVSLTGSLDG